MSLTVSINIIHNSQKLQFLHVNFLETIDIYYATWTNMQHSQKESIWS